MHHLCRVSIPVRFCKKGSPVAMHKQNEGYREYESKDHGKKHTLGHLNSFSLYERFDVPNDAANSWNTKD